VLSHFSFGQIIVSGTVFDSTKLYAVPGVQVFSTSGNSAITDSLGIYHIATQPNDSIHFFYKNKFTVKFPIADVKDYSAFNISLHIRTEEKYKLLSPVTIYSDTYKRDSLDNRITYNKYFKDKSSVFQTSYDVGGPAGLDLDALIGAFQFKKNRQRLAFQTRLIQEEQDRFVDYRFSKRTITRITGLKGENLDLYQKLYRPTYLFVLNCSLLQFYQYILNSFYAFKIQYNIP
jgi:hypothetical protein